MSADNFLYVRLHNDRWVVTMESASDGPRLVGDRFFKGFFDTWHEAYEAAEKWEQEEPYGCEYGIKVEIR